MRVKANIYFFDLKANCSRSAGDVFEVSESRYKELAEHPQFGAMVEKVATRKPARKRTTTKKD